MSESLPQALKRTARVLKNAAPEEFAEFQRVLQAHRDELTVAVTEADAAEIMTAKGRAQHARFIYQIADECDRTPPPR